MIEDLKSTDIVNKVGGRYRLTALIQKRLDELMEGARPLIEDAKGKTQLEIVVQEILQDKIAIDYESGSINKPGE
ncbi:MAG: DNA-directed RNA polymerase subunit omega [Phycisphaerae bacterium]|nr:DNA-directed RNA polymerase subunit omega [Phycisphaerae bacterium]MDD5380491.1 DNA-directed RNA polymerase subunit omega [Phycisphaerae bacterium]